MKICLVKIEFFHADGCSYRQDKTNSRFHNFVYMPKK